MNTLENTAILPQMQDIHDCIYALTLVIIIALKCNAKRIAIAFIVFFTSLLFIVSGRTVKKFLYSFRQFLLKTRVTNIGSP